MDLALQVPWVGLFFVLFKRIDPACAALKSPLTLFILVGICRGISGQIPLELDFACFVQLFVLWFFIAGH